MDSPSLIPYLVVWAIAIMLVVWQTWRTSGAGLMLAYCFQMLMLYWVGAAVHILPWAALPDSDQVARGFQQCTYAAVAFAVGSLVLGSWLVKLLTGNQLEQSTPNPGLPRAYIVYGICSYFVLAPTLGKIS